jgi:hypothetical protein
MQTCFRKICVYVGTVLQHGQLHEAVNFWGGTADNPPFVFH